MKKPNPPRMIEWLVVTLLCMAAASAGLAMSTADPGAIGTVAGRLATVVWKLGLQSLGAYAGYRIDLKACPYARPDMFLAEEWRPGELPVILPGHAVPFAASMLRRAMIMGACMFGIGLGA